MKKYIVILFLSFAVTQVNAQYTIAGAPSLDAALGQLQGQEAQQWGEEAKKFAEIIKQAKKAYDIYSEVSSALKSFKELTEFMKTFSQMVSTIKESAQHFNSVGVLTPDEIKMIEAFYKGISTEMEGTLSVIEQSSQQDNKMTMGERIKGIHIAFDKLQNMMAKVIYFNDKMNKYVEIKQQEDENLVFLKNIYKSN